MDKSLKMVCGAFYIPSGKHNKPQGEDAHFIAFEHQTIGVADGVGGWNKKGVDSGEYARQLMNNAHLATCDSVVKSTTDLKKILEMAYERTNVEGSSTACILSLKNNNLLAVNVGDSGFMLIRDGEFVYKSPIQQRSFNSPFQLGVGPSSDKPNVAEVFKIKAKLGDVIIVATDGLFDNLHLSNIEAIAKMVVVNGGHPVQAAWAIAEHAYHISVDERAVTPFAEASWNAGRKFIGGKKDDITVIVALVGKLLVRPRLHTRTYPEAITYYHKALALFNRSLAYTYRLQALWINLEDPFCAEMLSLALDDESQQGIESDVEYEIYI